MRLASNLVQRFSNTIVFEETKNEVLFRNYDVDGLMNVISEIKQGRRKLVIKSTSVFSPIGSIVVTDRSINSIGDRGFSIKAFQNSIVWKKVKLVCLSCGRWEGVYRVYEQFIPSNCPVCKSRILGITEPSDIFLSRIVSKRLEGILSASDQARFWKAWKSVSLYMTFSRKAPIALATYGVGEDTAARILDRSLTDSDFYALLYIAQKNFVMYRKYW